MPAFRALCITALCITGFASPLLAPAALAEDVLELRAGLWRTRSTRTMEMPGMPAMPPRTEESTECLDGKAFDPKSLFAASEDCRVEDVVVESSVMTFRVTCPAPQGQMTGDARYEVDGDRGKAHVEMNFSASGVTGKMTMDMDSERVDDCDASAAGA
jgi:hypothetical protein